MICIGSIKTNIIEEFASENWAAKILGPPNPDSAEVEFQKDDVVVFRKKFLDQDSAREYIKRFLREPKKYLKRHKEVKEKPFNLKRARLYSSPPTMDSGPSTNPFMSDGPGGLLSYFPNPREKQKRTVRRTQTSPSGADEPPYGNRTRYLYLEQRDSGFDRPGFDLAADPHGSHDPRNFKPSLPKGEFSPDIQDKPEEFNTNYTNEYGDPKTEQDRRADYLDKMRKKDVEQQQHDAEKFDLIYIDKDGKEASIGGMSYQMAVRYNSSPRYPRSRIVRTK